MSEEKWTSKLGNKYPKEEIELNHADTTKELDKLRRWKENAVCADCGCSGTVWSSVNLGAFLCLRCGSLHRALGTHISKPKGCTGTYLWGPDEIARMREIGNAKAAEIYGGIKERPSDNASDATWLEYLKQKYAEKNFTSTQHRSDESTKLSVIPTSLKNERKSPAGNVLPPKTRLVVVPEADLLGLNSGNSSTSVGDDFFTEFGL
jgi:hypothetical protein